MVRSSYTHVSITAADLDESVEFYEDVFGLEQIPTPNWNLPVQWLAVDGLQLHLVETEANVPEFHHFALHVDDLEHVYTSVVEHPTAAVEELDQYVDRTGSGEAPPVYYLPNGTVQLYVRDPNGTMIEVDYPDVEDLDPAVVTNTVERDDLQPPEPGEEAGDIYGEYGFDLDAFEA